MRLKWLRIACLMMILTYISSAQMVASDGVNEVQVDEQTRQMLMQKYGLEPGEESQAQQDFLVGDWGMSFRYVSETELLNKLMQVVPFWLWPAVWLFRMWV